MIIKKNKDKTYLCEVANNYHQIPSKKHYEDRLREIKEMEKPSDKELIELGKRQHPYYNNDAINLENQIQEIEEFESGNILL
jgi:hypothetical protein